MDTGGAAYLVELFTPSIAIVTQLKKLHHFSHLAVETSLQCNCSLRYSAVYKEGFFTLQNLETSKYLTADNDVTFKMEGTYNFRK